MSIARIYLSPGFFGFSSLGTYDYFCHVRDGLQHRFGEAGRGVEIHVVDVHPSASIRKRAATLAQVVTRSAGHAGPVHLLGHSTGGIDARLVASPTTNLHGTALPAPLFGRIRSVTTINAPHYGTPLASFFATLSGQRLLYLLSALTVAVLKVGAPPLALSSSLVASLAGVERAVGIRLRVIDTLTDQVIRMLDSASSDELREFLRLVRGDQGAVIQLSPEAMDLFQAGVEDCPSVRYQSVASYAPTPTLLQWTRVLRSPWNNISLPIFATMRRLTSIEHEGYPCAPPGNQANDLLREVLGAVPPEGANDGVVPIRSQVWGKLVWAGLGDHLDVVGHFHGREENDTHMDWLGSASGFTAERFDAMLDAVANGMLEAERG